ncbi:MAG: hypothetical protein DMF49_00845 [Acidobacteria bacterium]|nr:MAG: hypothetical protein DMF49_00845 [Acidobacteriota bacterium]
MVTRRITRQEMKHDEFLDLMSRLTLLFEQNWRQLAVYSGCAVAIVLAGVGIFAWTVHSRTLAEAELARASSLLFSPVQEKDAEAGLRPGAAFASDHARDEAALAALKNAGKSGGTVGSLAAYYQGVALLRLSRASEAEAAFQQAIAGAKDSVLRGLIQHALATTAAQRGDLATAEQRFREMAQQETGYPKDLVLFDLAKILDQQGKAQEASQIRQQLAKEFPDSPLGRESSPVPQPG